MLMNEKRIVRQSIGIVMLTHNRADRCTDCVKHAAAALRGLPGEILVVNNGQSAVNLPERIDGIPCRVIEPGVNLGAGARNIALEETASEYLLMLDDDAYIETNEQSAPQEAAGPNPMQILIDIFNSDPRIGVVAFRIFYDNRQEACLLPTVFHGCACAFRTSALKAIGGYPDDFLYYGEEYHVAFRIYQAGYRIVMSEQLKKVLHVRDGRGRDINRIVRLVVRNNISLWTSMLPWPAVVPAIRDTLRRYRLVARKEKAERGFIKACMELPLTIARGLRQRNPLTPDIFRKITLIEPIEKICEKTPEIKGRHLIICGAGKFPSFWLKVLKRHGVRPAAFWDTNSCWQGRKIQGIPVFVHPETPDSAKIPDSALFLLGTSSLPDTEFWKKQVSQMGARALNMPEQTEKNSPFGTFDLHSQDKIQLFAIPDRKPASSA